MITIVSCFHFFFVQFSSVRQYARSHYLSRVRHVPHSRNDIKCLIQTIDAFTHARELTITITKRKNWRKNGNIFRSHFGSLFPRVFYSYDYFLLWFIFIAFIFGRSWLFHLGFSARFCIMYNVALKLSYLIQLIESFFGLDDWMCVCMCDQWNWLEYLAIYCYIYIWLLLFFFLY